MTKHKISAGKKITHAEIATGKEIQLKPYERPYKIAGFTYKLKPPIFKDALYVTINNTQLPDGSYRPIEIFANSKNMDSFPWMVGLTRLASALMRQPMPFLFIIDELKDVFDPHGSYYIPNSQGKKANSIVAHIGIILEEHCIDLGLIEQQQLSDESKKFIEEKLAGQSIEEIAKQEKDVCPDCNQKEVVKLDNCPVCMNCGWSKCG